MTVWIWIGVGAGGLLALSLLVGLAIAAILGHIGDEIAQIQEAEPWTLAPLTRDTVRSAEEQEISSGANPRDLRSRSPQR
ncbi:MAG: hypothetical protein ACXVRQ_08880 [Gaiellaceae bacterium]